MAVDYYSKFFEIAPLSTPSNCNVVIALKKIFSRHGIPKLLFTDNGPHFAAGEFAEFSGKWNFDYDISALSKIKWSS